MNELSLTIVDLDEIFTNAPPLYISVQPYYNRRDKTGLFGLDLDISDELLKGHLLPVLPRLYTSPAKLLGGTYYWSGWSIGITPDMHRLGRSTRLDFRIEPSPLYANKNALFFALGINFPRLKDHPIEGEIDALRDQAWRS